MKLKDIKVGMKLKTKKQCNTVRVCNYNRKCKVINIEDSVYAGFLTIEVVYRCGETEWVNYEDLKLRKKDKLKAQGV